ncbi:MAG: glycosyltransferase family 2 protein [Solirubrobacteraceae bacterium]
MTSSPGHAARVASALQPTAVSVVVTTYRRVDRLAACLAGLRLQTLPATEVVVVVHASDAASAAAVDQLASEWGVVRRATVECIGLVAALNCGLSVVQGEIVAFVDDDAVPYSDWLERIVATFATDARIAAVGGRDVIEMDGRILDAPRTRRAGWRGNEHEVGRIQWFGRMIANHHVGVGGPRDVDVLKGVNMSFRREAVAELGFDKRLRGVGSQVHSELSICLPLKQRGRRVVYDSRIQVAHYPAPRPYGDGREDHGHAAITAFTHNEALAILDHFGSVRRLVYFVWGVALGTSASPGLAVLARDVIRRRRGAWLRFFAAQRGRLAAWRTHSTTSRRPVVTTRSQENIVTTRSHGN